MAIKSGKNGQNGAVGCERAELEDMMDRWVAANVRAEATRDWVTHLGPFYTPDAEYSWNVGPDEEFVARGVTQICDWALGYQMEGFEEWRYPYDKLLIDHVQGEAVGFWRQVAPATRNDGSAYEVAGVGGSWFQYAGDFKWSKQRDFFDFGNVMSLMIELAADGHLNQAVAKKIRQKARGELLAGHVKLEHAPSLPRRIKGYLSLARMAVIGR